MVQKRPLLEGGSAGAWVGERSNGDLDDAVVAAGNNEKRATLACDYSFCA